MKTPSGRFALVASLALLTGVLLLPSPARAQSDDFNDGNDNIGGTWFRYDPIGSHPSFPDQATYTFPNGGYRIRTMPSPSPAAVGPGRAGSLRLDKTYSDFYLAVDIVDFDDTVNQAFGIIARCKEVGLGTTDGYAFTFDFGGGDTDITRFVNENPTSGGGGGVTVTGNDRPAIVRGQKYRFVFIGVGPQLTGRVYQHPNLETPISEITGMDTNFTSGVCGLLVYDNVTPPAPAISPDTTFDNYFGSDVEPPRIRIVEANTSTRDLVMSWPAYASNFVFECSTELPGANWTPVTDVIFAPGTFPLDPPNEDYLCFSSLGAGNKYFRLRRP